MKIHLPLFLCASVTFPTAVVAEHSLRGLNTVERSLQVSAGDVTCTNEGYFYKYTYGTSLASDGYENQVGDIFLPTSPVSTPTPVVVVVHGGYWYDQYRRKCCGSDMEPLARDLQARGYVAVNLEYRRGAVYGGNDGGFTGTFNDLTDGIDALQFVKSECGFSEDLDLGRIVIAGHSAGGHLALWRTLSFGIPTADRDSTSGPNEYLHAPVLNPMAAIGLAAVSNFGDCGTASCSAVNNFMGTGTYSKTSTEVQNDLQVWSPYQMLYNANQVATASIPIKLIHATGDTTVQPVQSSAFQAKAASFSNIDVSVYSPPGGHFEVINPADASWACGVSQFLTSILESPPDLGCTVVDFETGPSGWSADPASTCTTGDFVVGTPEFMISSGVITQVCGDHTAGGGNAFFTAQNTAAGTNDVDGGECIGVSPTYSVVQESTLSIWYFHGQRDVGDDASGDFFALEISIDNGVNWNTLASYGDELVNAVWSKAEALVPGGSDVKIRIRVSDGPSGSDLVEAGVDDLVICPTATCSISSDCDDGLYCNGVETCVAGACAPGLPPICDDGVSCTDDTCDEGSSSCLNTPNDAACDNGLFCDGAETCDATTGCLAGTPPACDDGVACTDDSCDEGSGSCVYTPNDALCDDYVFCNGVETCNAISGCQAGTDPCLGQYCDEATDTCVECLSNGDCDDGDFCNGAETCVDSACQAGTNPCPGQACDESGDTCADCLANGDCDDGLYCNGEETCVGGSCQVGTPPACDDGVACTIDICDEVAKSCLNTPDDGLCDNAIFCDGVETCDAINGCQAGTMPTCDDGVGCTFDICDVLTDSCLNTLDDSFCDNDLFCDGAETCDAVNDCQAGTDPCPGQSCDEVSDACVTGAKMEYLVISSVGSAWQSVSISGFTDPIPVCSVHYTGSGDLPAVVRMQNVVAGSFDIRLQNPGDLSTPASRDMRCLVVENGQWTLPNGQPIEARKYTSSVTDSKGSWVGEQQQEPSSTFPNPVVVGQVMTSNDPDWSVFWSRGTTKTNPPTSTTLYTGKHVAEDTDTTRSNENVGYILMESAHLTPAGGTEYEAGVSTDFVRGYDNSPSYSVDYAQAFGSPPAVTIVSQVAMDGNDGGWPVLSGTQTASALSVAVDEDQIAGSERRHTTEQVAYISFTSVGSMVLS